MTGLAVHRLGNVPEGVFAGCLVAGVGLARRGTAGLLILPLVALMVFFASFLVGPAAPASQPRAAGVVVSITGLLAAGITLACGLMALVAGKTGERARLAATVGLIAGLIALAVGLTLELGDDKLRDIDPGVGATAAAVDAYVSRIAGWLLAVPLGLAAGALLGRLNQSLDRLGREPLPAFRAGGRDFRGGSRLAAAGDACRRGAERRRRFEALGPDRCWPSRRSERVAGCRPGPTATVRGGGRVLAQVNAPDRPDAAGRSGRQYVRAAGRRGPPMTARRVGDFELLQRLGRDGPYLLFRARQVSLDRAVMLKVLPARLASLERSALMRREAAAADKLDHPGILRVYEAGEAGGNPYLALAPVDGTRLAERLKDSALPPRLAVDLIRQLAEALLHAHERNLLHGSLRPEAVWVTREGQAG